MKQEKLQALLYAFIENREKGDTVDGIFNQSRNVQAHCAPFGNITTLDGGGRRELVGGEVFIPQGFIEPSSPLQFWPFAPLSPTQSNAVSAMGRSLVQFADQYSSGCPDNSSIKFETSCMIVAPEEQVISISIVRSDSYINNVTKVAWKTYDKTARSGIHYIGSDGEVVFDKGEKEKKIEIEILAFADDAIDLRFIVKLDDISGMFNPRPMTVTLKKTDHLYSDEKDVINDLCASRSLSVDNIKYILDSSLTSRTFHIALTHLCSTTDTVPVQFALAFDLSRLCLNKLGGHILPVLLDFFRMDDIEISEVLCGN